VIASRASRVTDGMLSAAAHAVAGLTNTSARGACLLPPVEKLRETSVAVAVAVAVARAAVDDGVATTQIEGDLTTHVISLMWQPTYRPIVAE